MPMTSAIHRLLTPLHQLLQHKSTPGILLFAAVVAAMVRVNCVATRPLPGHEK